MFTRVMPVLQQDSHDEDTGVNKNNKGNNNN
jgi:hypothetical protein